MGRFDSGCECEKGGAEMREPRHSRLLLLPGYDRKTWQTGGVLLPGAGCLGLQLAAFAFSDPRTSTILLIISLGLGCIAIAFFVLGWFSPLFNYGPCDTGLLLAGIACLLWLATPKIKAVQERFSIT